MLLRILKRDIRRKKSMNVILLLFVVICSMFLSSSVNNLMTVTNALDYFYKQSNANDYYVILRDSDRTEEWLDGNDLVQGYESHTYIGIGTDGVSHDDGVLEANSNISVTTLSSRYDFVFDQNDERIQSLDDGEIALSNSVCERNDLSIGDEIKTELGSTTLTFKLAYIMKDIVFGSDFMSFNQAIVSKNDFALLTAEPAANMALLYMYSIKTDAPDVLRNETHGYISTIIVEFFGSDVKVTYIMDIMMFAIFIVVSVCLIFIAFTLLRFTINTTIQEDYKEIGILRAIGLPDTAVVTLYLVKYLALAILGSVIGVLLSMPFGEMLLGSLRKNIVMNPGNRFPIIPVSGALFIVLVIYLFCRHNTRKIIRLSAVQAIRSGSSGKRYSRSGKLRLSRFKSIPVVWFMALNDISSNRRNYTVLFVTFIFGAILFLFPTKAVSTLNSDEIVRYMGVSRPDIFILDSRSDEIMTNPDYDAVIADIRKLEQTYENAGVLIELCRTFMFSSSVYRDEVKQSIPIYTTQTTEDTHNNVALSEGSYPKLANEIIMTEKTMKKLGVGIGDEIHIVIGADDRDYIIVGSYETMMNMGDGLQLSSLAGVDFSHITAVHEISGVFSDRRNIDIQTKTLRRVTPDYEIMSPQEYTQHLLPGIAETVASWKYRIGGILLVIFCLISVLMSRTFYLKDLGDTALLKSIGFSVRALHLWQVLRISISTLAATSVGFLLSIPLTPVLNRFTFGIMGAPNIPTTVSPVEIYLLYPLIMLAGVCFFIYISTISIRRVTMHDLGAIE